MKRSISQKLVTSFILISVPLLMFLISNNIYAKKVLLSEVATSNHNLVTMYMEQIDKTLDSVDTNMYYLVNQEHNLVSFGLSHDIEKLYFAKSNVLEKLTRDANYYKGVDMYFAYSNGDLINTRLNPYEKSQFILKTLNDLFEDKAALESYLLNWKVIKIGDEYYLLRIMRTDYNVHLGALVGIDRLNVPLKLLDLGQNGESLFVSDNGHILTKKLKNQMYSDILKVEASGNEEPFRAVQQPKGTLLVTAKSEKSDMSLVVIIPEKNLLQNLPYFQLVIYLLPVGAVFILTFYLLFLRKVFLKPIIQLIQGMQRVQFGDLNVRLPYNYTKEFDLINESFNVMVSQINNLKIDVYEEQIRTQNAELKHLQVQINPHFFLNSLNIIYSLAEVKNYPLIQKMVINLVNYFRFITNTHRSMVTLAEELEHIRNYLEIQSLRFTDHLIYDIRCSDNVEKCIVPALIIQPFVENAMVHGFIISKEPFHIQIDVNPDMDSPEEYFTVTVTDNGRGFAPEKLQKLQAGQYSIDSRDEHLGIWNVFNRLKLLYSGSAKINFDNGQDKGAVVRIKFPYKLTSDHGGKKHV